MWRPIPNAKKGEHSFDPLQISYYDYNKPTPRVPTAPFPQEKLNRFRDQMEQEVWGTI